jgi:hypothetical protein
MYITSNMLLLHLNYDICIPKIAPLICFYLPSILLLFNLYSRLFHGRDQCVGRDTEHGVGDPVLFESTAQLERPWQKTWCVD